MTSEKQKKDDNYQKSLAILAKRAFDVKFDIDTTVYKPLENIGIGAYGVVCSAIHRKYNDRVAIKKIPSVFDVKDAAKRTYREIKILKHFKHDNIIHIREILKPKETINEFRDVYVVFDLMESDLHKIVYSKQELTEEHCRYFLYQILRGLKYIHSAHVIHRDLKPSNLLVNEDCQLRIGDFGMARGFSSSQSENKHFMTQYVATRYYRAPEIMLSLIEYGAAVDMWSVGCIFAEMLGRKYLFPGKNSVEQIKLIVGCLGTPDKSLLDLCQSPIIRTFLQEMGKKEAVPWQKLYPKASKKAINLLGRMLVLNPKNRITVGQALVHPYLNKYHDPDDEPICVPTFNFDFENEDLTLPQLRVSIHKEIMTYHEPTAPTLSFNAELRPVPKTECLSSSQTIKQASDSSRSQTATGEAIGEITQQQDLPPLMSSQQTSLIVADENVFKKPQATKKSPVTVKTENLLKAETTDVEMLSARSNVEMLSARSTDDRQPMSAKVTEEQVSKPDVPASLETGSESTENKTISEGTKNLIKAALLNASFKKRTDSVGDDDRQKPVTAAMRQKEREDKRKKKIEKTMERKRKEKKKNVKTEELLTSEDKEMLSRWTKMQKVNVPIAPKPRSDSFSQGQEGSNQEVAHNLTSGQQGSSDRGNNTRRNQDSIDPSFSKGQVGFHGNERNVQQGTLDLLQQRILGNAGGMFGKVETNSDESQLVLPTIPMSQPVATVTLPGNSSQTSNTSQPKTEPCSSMSGQDSSVNKNPNNYNVDFSNVGFGDIDFLTLVTSPDIVNILSQSLPDQVQHVSLAGSQAPVQTRTSMQFTTSSSPQTSQTTLTNQTPPDNFLQRLCEQSPAGSRTSDGFVPLQLPEDNNTNQLSVSPNYVNRLSPNHYQSSQSPGSQHSSVSLGQRLSPFPEPVTSQQTVGNQSQPPKTSYQSTQQNVFSFINQSTMHPSQIGNEQHQQSSSLPFQNVNLNIQNKPNDPTALFMSSRDSQNQSVGMQQTQFGYRTENQSAAQQEVKDSQNSSSNSNSPPPLTVNTRQSQLTFQNIFNNPVPGPSNAANQLDETQLDLVALLTKQLSKSNVDDLCPPLALTPRGTGAGYGLGVDLDMYMGSTAANDGPVPEPSPLSSSILADWMEVTGNMNIDMEALEQELQSPMALSYNDLHMYPP